jgi:hypothetical protein
MIQQNTTKPEYPYGMNMTDGLNLMTSKLFIAVITRCSANFGTAADS